MTFRQHHYGIEQLYLCKIPKYLIDWRLFVYNSFIYMWSDFQTNTLKDILLLVLYIFWFCVVLFLQHFFLFFKDSLTAWWLFAVNVWPSVYKDRAQKQDFWSRFLLLHSPFLFPLFFLREEKRGKELPSRVQKLCLTARSFISASKCTTNNHLITLLNIYSAGFL